MPQHQQTPEQRLAAIRAARQGRTPEERLAALRRQQPERKKPRGYRTPEQIARLNKIDAAVAELGPWETLAGGAAAAGQGLLLGWGDEAAAALRALGPKNYREALADVRNEQGIFRKEYPKADLALTMAGGGLVPLPMRGSGWRPAAKNAGLLGAIAGTGFTEGDLLDRGVGAGIGAGLGLGTVGLLGGTGATVRGGANLLRRMRGSPEEKALAYLRKLAATRPGGLTAVEADVATARAAGGQPVMAEALGESGIRGLLAATKAPLSEAGEVTRTALGARGATVLPRADVAALEMVGAGDMRGIRGPEYLNDWIRALSTDETTPLYLRAEAEAAAKEGAAGKATAKFAELLEKAGIKALPAPGQSTITRQSAEQALVRAVNRVRRAENVGSASAVSKQVVGAERAVLRAAIEDFRAMFGQEPPETIMQGITREGLETLRGPVSPPEHPGVIGVPPAREIRLRAANDINVRGPEYTAPPSVPAAPPTSVDAARGLIESNSEVQSLMRMLASDPKKAHLMDNPTSYNALEALYHAANARVRDLTGSTARSRVQEKALGNIASTFLKAMEEIAPTAKTANVRYAQLSRPDDAFRFGMAFDKETPEALDKAIQTGFLPDGTQVPVESIRLGVVQRLRELLVKRAGSQALGGAAKEKATLAGLNSEQLNRQLKATLGDKYEAMVPVIRQLLREEGTRMFVTGGKNVAENIAPEGAGVADLFGAFMGGIGFSPQAALRRAAGTAAKAGLMERAAVGFGRGATARTKMLVATDKALDTWLKKAKVQHGKPLVEQITRFGRGRIARGLTVGLLGQKDEE